MHHRPVILAAALALAIAAPAEARSSWSSTDDPPPAPAWLAPAGGPIPEAAIAKRPWTHARKKRVRAASRRLGKAQCKRSAGPAFDPREVEGPGDGGHGRPAEYVCHKFYVTPIPTQRPGWQGTPCFFGEPVMYAAAAACYPQARIKLRYATPDPPRLPRYWNYVTPGVQWIVLAGSGKLIRATDPEWHAFPED